MAMAPISLEEVLGAARLLAETPRLLRRPLPVRRAEQELRWRLEAREPRFLDLVRRAVYEHAASPYAALLRSAGCEYGDLEKLVRGYGVEDALARLYRAGVYLTADELKARRPVVRGSAVLGVNPALLRNPTAAPWLGVRGSGSRSAGLTVVVDLALFKERAVNAALVFDAWGALGWRHALWGPPGGAALLRLFRYGSIGCVPERWFTPVALSALHPRYRWSVRVLKVGGLLGGVRIPSPEHTPLDDMAPIARWMSEVLGAGQTPHVQISPSAAVRVSLAARRHGIDLAGAQFTVTGEPATPLRQSLIEQTGARLSTAYTSTETGGPLGHGCLNREAPDEVHLWSDLHAVVQPGLDAPGLPARAVLVSTLSPTSPLMLLNVSMGDEAIVTHRDCGCRMQRLGWTTHLHTIRSFEKLTGLGVTFLDVDVMRVLDALLPERFGGAPTQYQLIEDETGDGQPRLRLLVHPDIGPVDPGAVRETFLAAIAPGTAGEGIMGALWRDGGVVEVERRAPYATESGKILHLRLHRSPGTGHRSQAP